MSSNNNKYNKSPLNKTKMDDKKKIKKNKTTQIKERHCSLKIQNNKSKTGKGKHAEV